MLLNALINSDKKYWAPVEQVVKWLCDQIPADARVLEIGPGHMPFPRADVYVDYYSIPDSPYMQILPPEKSKVLVNVSIEPLPFPNKSFDFVYCRHVLEDMFNPFLLIHEMARVGKGGYIETPSPMVELCRGVDDTSPPYRGYHHHRYICWVHEGEFRLISKYPFVEYLNFAEADIAAALREGPRHWNTYLLWKDQIRYAHRQNGPDYILSRDYAMILKGAMDSAMISNGVFWQKIPTKVEIVQALPKFAAV